MADLRVLFVASECAPFSKTGGLADVAGSLPKALRKRGVDVRVVMPLYAGMPWNEFEVLEGALSVPVAAGRARGRVRMSTLPGSDVPIYFLEHHHYYDRPYLYGPPGDGYSDNLERFVFLSRGALELTKALGWVPDIVHANDWQTALLPVYINTVEWAQPLHGAASVYTIHNLDYQGIFDSGALFLTGLGWDHYNPSEFEHFGVMNLTKAALRHSTVLTTVSPTYAREIQTQLYGRGLDGEMSRRSSDLYGMLNGIDVDEWNPATDRYLPAQFDVNDLAGKAKCKAALQQEAGLPARPDVPLFGLVGRLIHQKGVDVLARTLSRVLSMDLQLVLLGTGDRSIEELFRWVAAQRRDRFCAWLDFNNPRAHRIEAGCDFFLMPSRFEPCGLNQLYSLRYGTLPIVRGTGGLVDTVSQYDEPVGGGTGFILWDLTPDSLANIIGWAVSTYYDRPQHIDQMRRRAMAQDFSWQRTAAEYHSLYLRAYERRRGHPFTG